MADPRKFILQLPADRRPARISLPEVLIPDIDWFNARRAVKRRYDPVMGIEGIVVHATAGSTSGGALQHWRTESPASAHWIVPAEREQTHGQSIIACVYEARAANHTKDRVSNPAVNRGRANVDHWTLGIEIVNRQDLDQYTDPYSDWQIAMAAQIVRYCWAKYPNLKWVFSHASIDPGNRADPGRQFPWDGFCQQVLHDPPQAPRFALFDAQPEAGEMDDPSRSPCCA